MFETLKTINNAALQFLAASHPEDVYHAAISGAQKISQSEYGSIFFHQNNKFQRIYSNVPKNKQGFPSTRGYSFYALKTGKAYIHTKHSLQQLHPELYNNGLKEIIIIPLRHQNTNVGILALQSYKRRHLQKYKLETLQFLATMASLGIHKTQENATLRESVANRDLFMSIASHELKTPITTISMYVQLVRNHVAKNILPHKNWVDVLHTETEQLTQLINELLTKEKFSLYDMDYSFKKINLQDVIQDTLEKYQTTHPQRIFTFIDKTKKGNAKVINADYNKLQQVIINILNNAVKFSPSTSPITVALEATKTHISFAIVDQGHGIAKNIKKNLFDKFFKGDPRKDGMGLGLYVAKTIIDKHHGKIRIKSAIPKGTTVQVYLPTIS